MTGPTDTATGTDPAPDFAQLATRELLTNGDRQDPIGVAARHRARTWALLALAQATETQALETKGKPCCTIPKPSRPYAAPEAPLG